MDSAEVAVFEQAHQVVFGGGLQRLQRGRLPPEDGGAEDAFAQLAHHARKGQAPQQQLGGFLKLSNLHDGAGSGPIPMPPFGGGRSRVRHEN
eukprot:ctg_2373.g496